VETERNLLARHVVQAEYRGLEQGREPMLRIYPPMPAKIWTKFSVVEVQEYEKPGQYGEEALQPGAEKAFERDLQPKAMQNTLAGLVPGDRVRLGWNHDYVTTEFTSPDGHKSTNQFPEHTITVLEKLSGGVGIAVTSAASPIASYAAAAGSPVAFAAAPGSPVTYAAAPMVGFAAPMPTMASPERFGVSPETFAKLAAGGSLSADEMAQISGQAAPGSPVAVAPTPTAITSAPAAPASPTLVEPAPAAAAAAAAAAVTSAPASRDVASKKKSSKKKSLKASKKKRSNACCT